MSCSEILRVQRDFFPRKPHKWRQSVSLISASNLWAATALGFKVGICIFYPDLPLWKFQLQQSRILTSVRPSLIQGQNPLCFQPKTGPAKQKAWALSGPTSGKEIVYQNGRHMSSSWVHPLPRGREGLISFTEQHQNRGSSGESVSRGKGKKPGANDVSCKCWGQWPQVLSFPLVCG